MSQIKRIRISHHNPSLQIGEIITKLTKILEKERPDTVIVEADSNPGILKEVNDDNILVGTGNGSLKILKASYQNKYELREIFSSTDIGSKLGL